MNIQQSIAKAHYVATDAQVEQLASAQYSASAEAEGHNLTYLRILVVRIQAKVGTKRRGRPLALDAALSVVEQEATPLYAAVLRGVTSPDIAADDGLEAKERSRRALERNRRSTFARSAKTTLVNYVRGGGDVRGLDAHTVTKAALRAAVEQPEPEGREQRILQRAQGAILRAINRLARASPDAALDELERLVTALQARQAELEGEGEAQQESVGRTTTITAAPGRAPPEPRAARTRVGIPQFHRGAP